MYDITVTPEFLNHVDRITSRHRTTASGAMPIVVLDVKTSGCSGLSYSFAIEYAVPGQEWIESRGILSTYVTSSANSFVVTKKAAEVLHGSTIDFVTEGLTSGIKVSNPNETSQCGCGKSFSI